MVQFGMDKRTENGYRVVCELVLLVHSSDPFQNLLVAKSGGTRMIPQKAEVGVGFWAYEGQSWRMWIAEPS